MSSPDSRTEKHTAEADITTASDDKPSRAGCCSCFSFTVPALCSMIGCLLLGIVFALLHHFYYRYLNKKPVQEHPHQQQWASRIGTALAFVTKLFLALAVIAAYTQCVWRTARRKFISLRGLDAMFSATSDATAFFTTEILLKSSTLLALIVWLIPIAAIVTPSTLSIEAEFRPATRTLSVPAPNFITADFLAPSKPPAGQGIGVGNTQLVQLHASNLLSSLGSLGSISVPPSRLAHRDTATDFNGPRPALSRLALTVLLTGDIRPISAPLNASFELSFYAPSITCDPADATRLKNMSLVTTGTSGVTVDIKAAAASADLWQLLVGVGVQGGGGVSCRVYNASYDVSFDFLNGQQVVSLKRPVQQLSALPPSFNQSDQQLSNHLAFLQAFTSNILGEVSHTSDPINYTVNSLVLQTELAYGPDLYQVFGNRTLSTRHLTLKDGIEGLWQNYTLSLFSSEVTADLNIPQAPTQIQVNLVQNVFVYNARNLALAYGLAVFLAASSVCVGIYARFENHIDHSNTFSSILRSVRHTDLDSLMGNPEYCQKGQCLGRKKMVGSLERKEVRFEVTDDERGVAHAAWVLRGS